jgi:2'-5' RNA ligase
MYNNYMELIFPLQATFLALPLENEAKWQFQALQEELKEYSDCLRFQNPASPHLTLYYWNEIMEIEIGQIKETATKIATNSNPFTLSVESAETFGSRGEDRVLFLKCSFSDELAHVKKACPWPENRPFKAHITLARMNHPQKFAVVKKNVMKKLKDCQFEIPIDRLRLYAMVEGRRQTAVEDYILQG